MRIPQSSCLRVRVYTRPQSSRESNSTLCPNACVMRMYVCLRIYFSHFRHTYFTIFSRGKKSVSIHIIYTHTSSCVGIRVSSRIQRTDLLFLRKSSNVIVYVHVVGVCEYVFELRMEKKKMKIFHASTLPDSPR